MVAKDKNGKPLGRPDWACRPCAYEFQDALVPPTQLNWKMSTSTRCREMLLTYGRLQECCRGHEKKLHHLCKFADLYSVLRQRQNSGRRRGDGDGDGGGNGRGRGGGDKIKPPTISDKDKRIAELEKAAARKDRLLDLQRERHQQGLAWEEPPEEEEEEEEEFPEEPPIENKFDFQKV